MSLSADKTKYIATMGLLLALAVGISFLEQFLPLPLGVKPGLSSLVIMLALLLYDAKSAWTLTLLKAGFVFLTRSVTAGFLSASGAVLSLFVMLLLLRVAHSSLLLMSACGGIAHNLGQVCMAMLLLQNTAILYYLPLLIISGCIAGIGTGICLHLLLPPLQRTLRHM